MRRSILVILFVTLNLWPVALGRTKFESLPRSIASDILESMTPEERVGQLFIVTFEGSELQEDSPILDLIASLYMNLMTKEEIAILEAISEACMQRIEALQKQQEEQAKKEQEINDDMAKHLVKVKEGIDQIKESENEQSENEQGEPESKK